MTLFQDRGHTPLIYKEYEAYEKYNIRDYRLSYNGVIIL